MSISKMKKLSFLIAKQDTVEVLNFLQETAVTQIDQDEAMETYFEDHQLLAEHSDDRVNLQELDRYTTRMANLREPLWQGSGIELSAAALKDLIQESHNWQIRLKDVFKILKEYSVQSKGLFSNKKPLALEKRYMQQEEQERLLEAIVDIESLLVEKRNLTIDLAAETNYHNSIEKWKDLEFPKRKDIENYSTDFGYFLSADHFHVLLDKAKEQDLPLAGEIYHRDEDSITVLLAYPKSRENEIKALIQDSELNRFPLVQDNVREGNFREAYKQSTEKIDELNKRLEAIESELKQHGEKLSQYEVLFDVISADIDKLEAILNLNSGQYISAVSAYVPETYAESVSHVLENRFNAFAILAEPKEGEDLPPTLLDNPKWAQPIEPTIETFSSPHYFEDLDPSMPMLITYGFFFGSMLSDIGYGLLLVIACALGIWKFKAEGGMRKTLQLFLVGGLFATAFGVLYGSLFGGVLGTLSNGAIEIPSLWFNPMDDPIKLMVWSMVFGAGHLFISMGIDIANKTRKGDWYSAAFSVAPWYLIIIGIGLMLINVAFGKYIAIVGAALVLLMSVRSWNIFKRIFGGASALFGVTSWLSDLLSYTRILALTLATSVIAMVVNLMANMIGLGGFKMIFTFLVLLAGHGLNLALSTLSAYVHTTRLHYVEFFGKFFNGGGRPFAPLKINGQYTKVQEKNIVEFSEREE